jgi:hypothetical protein
MVVPATPGAAAELRRARAALHAALGHRQAAARLEERVDRLEATLAEGRAEVGRLRHQLSVEEADVQHWTHLGFGPFVYWLIGRLDERRERERFEAEEAAVRLADEADRAERVRVALSAARHELSSARELATVDRARELVRSLLHDFVPDASKQLEHLEEQHAATLADVAETREAMQACEQAIDLTEAALDSMSSAANWGTWDLWGGGIIASSIKHQKVDDGLVHVQRLNAAMSRLRREMGDVGLSLDVPVGLEAGSTARVFDVWFDNIFSDWNMQDRIETMQESVGHIGTRLIEVHRALADHQSGLQRTAAYQRAALDELYLSNR